MLTYKHTYVNVCMYTHTPSPIHMFQINKQNYNREGKEEKKSLLLQFIHKIKKWLFNWLELSSQWNMTPWFKYNLFIKHKTNEGSAGKFYYINILSTNAQDQGWGEKNLWQLWIIRMIKRFEVTHSTSCRKTNTDIFTANSHFCLRDFWACLIPSKPKVSLAHYAALGLASLLCEGGGWRAELTMELCIQTGVRIDRKFKNQPFIFSLTLSREYKRNTELQLYI